MKDNKYQEVMEHIEVTEEMRTRILENIQQEFSYQPNEKSKVRPFLHWKRYISVAAVVALVLFGSLSWLRHSPSFSPDSSEQSELAVSSNEILEFDSLTELELAVDFKVEELTWKPFEPQTTTFVSYYGELAQVEYIGNDATITLRKAKGIEDPSGVFSDYDTEENLEINGLSVTLQGSSESYSLAVWTDGNYSWSIYTDTEYDLNTWENILSSLE